MTQLSIADAEELAGWFLHKMTADQRGRLMAERPQLYGRVFPGVRSRFIIERVQSALEARPAPCPVDPRCYREWPHAGSHTPDDGPDSAPGHYHDPVGRYDYCTDPACPRS